MSFLSQAKKVKYLICTDVAARGLDISKLPFGMYIICLPVERISNINQQP